MKANTDGCMATKGGNYLALHQGFYLFASPSGIPLGPAHHSIWRTARAEWKQQIQPIPKRMLRNLEKAVQQWRDNRSHGRPEDHGIFTELKERLLAEEERAKNPPPPPKKPAAQPKREKHSRETRRPNHAQYDANTLGAALLQRSPETLSKLRSFR